MLEAASESSTSRRQITARITQYVSVSSVVLITVASDRRGNAVRNAPGSLAVRAVVLHTQGGSERGTPQVLGKGICDSLEKYDSVQRNKATLAPAACQIYASTCPRAAHRAHATLRPHLRVTH